MERVGAEPPSYPRPDLFFPPGLQSGLWKQTAEGLHRLAATIPVLIDRRRLIRRAVRPLTSSSWAPIPVYRDKRPRAPAEEARDFLGTACAAPSRDALMLKVSLGPVFEDRARSPWRPARSIRPNRSPSPVATLRDADGTLLEGASTGADGAGLFRDLDIGENLIRCRVRREGVGSFWIICIDLMVERGFRVVTRGLIAAAGGRFVPVHVAAGRHSARRGHPAGRGNRGPRRPIARNGPSSTARRGGSANGSCAPTSAVLPATRPRSIPLFRSRATIDQIRPPSTVMQALASSRPDPRC